MMVAFQPASPQTLGHDTTPRSTGRGILVRRGDWAEAGKRYYADRNEP